MSNSAGGTYRYRPDALHVALIVLGIVGSSIGIWSIILDDGDVLYNGLMLAFSVLVAAMGLYLIWATQEEVTADYE